ncbi:MAG: hypothetical protein Athens101428_466 [Candidatus Berkelbacteria bacterium Athens1014_28]|uniref:Uncharacterized protein n=1 Tax=Candidatus Berkelbacteria bacterium Athens1014_28 TaxID=2017145 RepID=A0A554LM40_9BACT|nr:MAG: hypothetical protein Athens101428_466 [Candidatus Berkelbacteria bacterium Athens1014_28]
MGEKIGDDETGAEDFVAPEVEQPTQPQPAKVERVMTPEEREQIQKVVYEIALSKQGKFLEEERPKNEEIAASVIEKSLASAKAAGIQLSVELMSDFSKLTRMISEREEVGISISDDTIQMLKDHDLDQAEELYTKLADSGRLFSERGHIAPPSREEVTEIYGLIESVLSEKGDGGVLADEFLKFNYYLKEYADVRWSDEGEGKITSDILAEALISIMETGVSTEPTAITTEDALRILGDSGIKVPVSWKKCNKGLKMNITLAMQTAQNNFSENATMIETSEGPIITIGGQNA